jgi:hypothetical protein
MSNREKRIYLWKFAASYRGYSIVPIATGEGFAIGIFDAWGEEINSPEIEAVTLADVEKIAQTAIDDDIYQWISSGSQELLDELRHAGVFAPIV